jgi:hypothetical protein
MRFLRPLAFFGIIFAATLCVSAAANKNAPLPDRIEFNRDIRPILAENCYSCHGPDAGQRKAKLRLDTKDGLFNAIKDIHPVVPEHADQSELYRRITTDNADDRMPEPKSGRRLSPRQIALIKRWIDQGARWQGHWAFTPPTRLALPRVQNTSWVRNAIDNFALARMEAEGLKPSPQADKSTLIRRVTLDLTGLPPTPREVDDFLADTAPDAYEKLVERLLADPHYGERMALDWLDGARYADTHGYHIDAGRDMSHWRDWVIKAFNQNKPFDQFTLEQLAGDLLPNATTDQKIASGFNRNNMINFEGGAIPEEYLTAYLLDRTNTTSTVFLGLTLNCCQCHDHKYDPFTQKDYYQLYAFFNSIPENGLDGQKGNAGPLLMLPNAGQKKKLDEFATSIAKTEKTLAAANPEAEEAQAKWEKSLADAKEPRWTRIDAAELKSVSGAEFKPESDGSYTVTGPAAPTDTYTISFKPSLSQVTGIRLEALPDERLAAGGPGRSANGNFVLTGVNVAVGTEEKQKAVPLLSASADFSQDKFNIATLARGMRRSGWAIYPQVGQPHAAVFELQRPIDTENDSVVSLKLEFNSQFSQHEIGRLRISVTSDRSRESLPPEIAKIVAVPNEKRSEKDQLALRTWYRGQFIPEFRATANQLEKLRKDRDTYLTRVPNTMVMQELLKPRTTRILVRGQYDKFGEEVRPNTPTALPPMRNDEPRNRLGLAEWMVDPANPLMARVTVNRLWQSFLGTGLVKTPGDFGTQGDMPSHPELLDWLACQFRDGDDTTPKWDVKAMVRMIVTSSTYRQSSRLTPELVARDPEDRWLERGPRFRLNAEFIRDQALAISGLLNDQIGGQSVFPYQPKGLWEELMSRADGAKWTAQVYTPSHGKDLYRRSMYTFWKRTSPPPALSTFDAPDREVCTVKRSRTNTPLQALVLWNDPTYVEASRKMAERVMTEAGPSVDQRLKFAFGLATSRPPTDRELSVLRQVFQTQLDAYRNDPMAIEKLLGVGESPRNLELDPTRLAAWTMVCSTILNLDETVTRS